MIDPNATNPNAPATAAAASSSPRFGRLRKRLRIPLLVLAAVGLPIGGYCGYQTATGNFAIVRSGEVYRSGQMSDRQLTNVIRQYGIKTVLNLRGSNPEDSWYQRERDATLAEGATQVDMSLSSCEWMSRVQARTLLEMLETCERPILIHCKQGAERTGLASTLSELLRPGVDLEEANRQFSIWRLYLRVGEGKVMSQHIEQYQDWLGRRGLTHSPERLRLWIAEGFMPGKPTREDWPYDPYPLVTVTRPQAQSQSQTETQTQASVPAPDTTPESADARAELESRSTTK